MFQISLEAARVNAEMTQLEAAEKMGVTPNTISSWEKGKTKIPVQDAVKLCGIYLVPMENIRFPV